VVFQNSQEFKIYRIHKILGVEHYASYIIYKRGGRDNNLTNFSFLAAGNKKQGVQND
jgi:hypothetical protein